MIRRRREEGGGQEARRRRRRPAYQMMPANQMPTNQMPMMPANDQMPAKAVNQMMRANPA